MAKAYLILYNIQKRGNINKLLQSARNFNISHIYVIGQKKQLTRILNLAEQLNLSISSLSSFEELESIKSFQICGIEIMENAENIHTASFDQDTAFMLGNEVRSIP